jgi:hypothetical protein
MIGVAIEGTTTSIIFDKILGDYDGLHIAELPRVMT